MSRATSATFERSADPPSPLGVSTATKITSASSRCLAKLPESAKESLCCSKLRGRPALRGPARRKASCLPSARLCAPRPCRCTRPGGRGERGKSPSPVQRSRFRRPHLKALDQISSPDICALKPAAFRSLHPHKVRPIWAYLQPTALRVVAHLPIECSEVRLVLVRRPSRAGRNSATTACPRFEGSAQLLVQIAGGLAWRSGYERHARAKEGANGSERGKKTAEGAHLFLSFLPPPFSYTPGIFVLSINFIDISAFYSSPVLRV
jgi:hypothetical protein